MNGIPILAFARMDSRRLAGKVLGDIGGRPMLGRVLDRLRQVSGARSIVVATSDRPVDDPIAAFAESDGVDVYRGSANDVADRALACCEARQADSFVRISGDSPFVDPDTIERVIDLFESERPDIATNVFPRSFPRGNSVEVISVEALIRARSMMSERDDREHVTAVFYRRAECFSVCNAPASEPGLDQVSIVVDTAADLEKAVWVMAQIGPKPDLVPLAKVVELARAWDARQVGA